MLLIWVFCRHEYSTRTHQKGSGVMSHIFARKFNHNLIPADGFSAEAMEKLKPGKVYKLEVRQSRNYKLLQKSFVVVQYAFDIWEPPTGQAEYRGKPIQKNLDRFREMLTILAGYYEPVYKLDGSVQLIAKSWSYAEMPDDEDFQKLYQSLITVIVEKVLTGYTGEDLDRIVNNIIAGFA